MFRRLTSVVVFCLLTATLVAASGKAAPEETGWYATLVTSKGDILIRLLPEQAPQSVAYFAGLARGELVWNDPFTGAPRKDPYYDGMIIHKSVAGQRFEAGDPTASGQGYAPFFLPHEGFGPVNFNQAGRIGNTRASGGLISGSMFFVSEIGMNWLNDRHPCFGIVLSGMEVVHAITTVKTDSMGKSIDPITLITVKVFSVGNPDPIPEPVYFEPEVQKMELRPEILKDGKWGFQRPGR